MEQPGFCCWSQWSTDHGYHGKGDTYSQNWPSGIHRWTLNTTIFFFFLCGNDWCRLSTPARVAEIHQQSSPSSPSFPQWVRETTEDVLLIASTSVFRFKSHEIILLGVHQIIQYVVGTTWVLLHPIYCSKWAIYFRMNSVIAVIVYLHLRNWYTIYSYVELSDMGRLVRCIYWFYWIFLLASDLLLIVIRSTWDILRST